jgi:hypothetical protein
MQSRLATTAHGYFSRLGNALRWIGLITSFGGAAFATTYQAGPWSVDVTLVTDKPRILLGEPTSVSFVVRNLSEENLAVLVGGDYRNELGRPSSFEVRVRRSDGQWVDQPKVGFSMGGIVGPQPLPAGGAYTFRLFLPHWATFETHGSYTVSARRTLQLLRAGSGMNFTKETTTDVVTQAEVKLEVEPRDPAALGELIKEYGEQMVRAAGGPEGDAAVLALAWIDDSRVVPYFRRALAIRSYTLKFIALHALGKFSTDEAFAALQAGMQAKPADFDAASGEQSFQTAATIRAVAAGALSRCKHPKARQFLLEQRHDTSEGVRITVLHVLGAMPSAEAIPLLQEMTQDKNPRVREEAERYLALQRTTPK